MNAQFLIALFQIAAQIIAAVQKAQWYSQGEAAYGAQQKALQDARIRAAQQAIGAPDAYAGVGLHDPNELA